MSSRWLILIESNTSGTGRLFCERARAIGLRPVVIARDPGRYPYLIADHIDTVEADTSDRRALLAACRGLAGELTGVTSSSDYFVGTAADVARSLGIPHPDPSAVHACRDKYMQRTCLAEHGIGGPECKLARTPDEAVLAAAAVGYPVVVKPVSGSGSICVARCENAREVAAAAESVLVSDLAPPGFPAQRAMLVENYLDGDEYSVEILDDKVIGITRKYLGPEPFFVETGHDFPAPLDETAQISLRTAAAQALRALGLGYGAAHVELRLTRDGPKVVEVNPRLAGGLIPRLVEEASGIDMIGYVVARSAGLASPLSPTRAEAASIRFLVTAAQGRLAELTGLAAARALPGVVEAGALYEPGQRIEVRNSFKDRLAYVITRAGSIETASRAADSALLSLNAKITPSGDSPMHYGFAMKPQGTSSSDN